MILVKFSYEQKMLKIKNPIRLVGTFSVHFPVFFFFSLLVCRGGGEGGGFDREIPFTLDLGELGLI